jgi:hypothetical protein
MEGNSNLKISRSVRSCICHSVPTRSVVQTGFNFCPHAIPMLRVPPTRRKASFLLSHRGLSSQSRRGTRGGSEGETAPPGLGDVVSAAARAPSRRRRRRRRPLPTSSGSDRAGPGCHRARRPAGQRRGVTRLLPPCLWSCTPAAARRSRRVASPTAKHKFPSHALPVLLSVARARARAGRSSTAQRDMSPGP